MPEKVKPGTLGNLTLTPKLDEALAEHIKAITSGKVPQTASGLVGGICCNGQVIPLDMGMPVEKRTKPK